MEEKRKRVEMGKTMKIDRKSKRASLLKSLISRHLLLFCPHFSDDVLPEYITVLVCNGKNQNQATEDLTAFLGQRTEEFVSWLWKLLSMKEAQLSALLSSDKDEITSSSCKSDTDRDKAKANRTFKNHLREGNIDSVNLMGGSCKTGAPLPKDYHSISTPPKERTNSKIFKYESSAKVPSSDRNCETKRVHVSEKHSRCTVFSSQRTYTTSLVQKECAPVLEYGPASEENSPQPSELSDKNFISETGPSAKIQNSNVRQLLECPPICYAENASRRSFSMHQVISSSQNNQSRQSVWDRLGKPQRDVSSRSQIPDVYVMDKKQCKEWSNQCSSLTEGQFSNPRVLSTTRLGKRQFDELGSQIDASMKTQKRTHNQHEKTRQSQKISETSQAVSTQVNDLKLRLYQIEKEMVNLRTKTNVITSSGSADPVEDDSRTIIVTNV